MSSLCSPDSIVRVDANRTIKDAVEAAARRQSGRQRISVTDLVHPMQAYYQRTRPDIEIPLERLQLMWTGTGFHRRFGATISSEEFLEQFLEMDGIVGKVDIYEDIPVELKTTGALPEDLLAQRPSYVDQLGMYCTMASNPRGAVVVYRREEFGNEPALRAFQLEFSDLDAIRAAMKERRDLLIDALEKSDPSALPQCEWLQRNCLYEGVCPCAGQMPSSGVVPPDTVSIQEDTDLTLNLLTAVAAWRVRPTWAISLNDLVFPRRGVLLRTVGREEEDESLAGLERAGFYGALNEALRYGEPGAFQGIAVSLETVKGVVRTHRGIPTIVRSTGTYEMIERDRLHSERPYWLDRLALECALVEADLGRIVIYYTRIPGDKFMVYDVSFRYRDKTIEEARRRIKLFEEEAPPQAFPGCGPVWMSQYCPYGQNCACL